MLGQRMVKISVILPIRLGLFGSGLFASFPRSFLFFGFEERFVVGLVDGILPVGIIGMAPPPGSINTSRTPAFAIHSTT